MIPTVIVMFDRAYRPQAGDVGIELKPFPGADLPVLVIDPQHGNHRPTERWPEVRPGDAACSFAARLAGLFPDGPLFARVVLTPGAGLDDFAAAACLCYPSMLLIDGDGSDPAPVWDRLEALARTDNAGQQGGVWAPGAGSGGVTEGYAGLSRLCATREIPLLTRVQFVAEWLRSGTVTAESSDPWLASLGITEPYRGSFDILPALDALARQRREEYVARCSVEVHGSLAVVASPPPSGDPSEGQGGPALGYLQAPVVLAYHQLPALRAACPACMARGEPAPATHCAHCGGQAGPDLPARRKYTVARHSGCTFAVDFAALLAALNAAEAAAGGMATWGGNVKSGIVGSPVPVGSLLPPEHITRLVLAALPAQP